MKEPEDVIKSWLDASHAAGLPLTTTLDADVAVLDFSQASAAPNHVDLGQVPEGMAVRLILGPDAQEVSVGATRYPRQLDIEVHSQTRHIHVKDGLWPDVRISPGQGEPDSLTVMVRSILRNASLSISSLFVGLDMGGGGILRLHDASVKNPISPTHLIVTGNVKFAGGTINVLSLFGDLDIEVGSTPTEVRELEGHGRVVLGCNANGSVGEASFSDVEGEIVIRLEKIHLTLGNPPPWFHLPSKARDYGLGLAKLDLEGEGTVRFVSDAAFVHTSHEVTIELGSGVALACSGDLALNLDEPCLVEGLANDPAVLMSVSRSPAAALGGAELVGLRMDRLPFAELFALRNVGRCAPARETFDMLYWHGRYRNSVRQSRDGWFRARTHGIRAAVRPWRDRRKPSAKRSRALEATRYGELARIVEEKCGSGAARTRAHHAAYVTRLANTDSQGERLLLRAYRLVGFGERPGPPFAVLMALLWAGATSLAMVETRSVDLSLAGLGNYFWLWGRIIAALPLFVLRLGTGDDILATVGPVPLAFGRAFTAIPLVFVLLALRRMAQNQ